MEEDRIWNRNFVCITIAYILLALGFYMLTPSIPLLLVDLGATVSQVGMVVTAYYVASITTRLLINLVILRIGKKRALFTGLFLSAIFMASYGLVESVGAVASLRVIQGMGFGTATTVITTMAVDFLPDSRRGQGLGYFSMGMVLAMAIAPAIAIFIMDNFGFIPSFLVAACTNLTAAVIVLFVDEPDIAESELQKNAEGKKKAIEWRNLYDKRLIVSSFIVLLFGIGRSLDLNYIALFAVERNLDHLSWYFVIQTATMFLIRSVMGRFADRKGRNWVIIPGGFAMLTFPIILSFANSSAVMLMGALFSGLGVGILAPNQQLWMLGSVEPEKRIVASSSYFNFVDIGSALGAPLMGLAAENFGYDVMFRAGSCAALLYLALYVAIGREKRVES